jgi:hypothetical protein
MLIDSKRQEHKAKGVLSVEGRVSILVSYAGVGGRRHYAIGPAAAQDEEDSPMNYRGSIAKTFAVMLVVALQLAFIPTATAGEKATLAGTVYGVDGKQPIGGAVLYAGDTLSGEIYTSGRTDDTGAFVLSDLPPASYELAVEKEGGLYVVGAPVQLAPGQTRDVQVAIHPQAAPDPKTASAKNKKKGFLDSPLMATFAIIGGAVVVGALISAADDADEGIASPFE